MSGPIHEFEAHLVWTGGAEGPTRDYRSYSRDYRVEIEGKPPLDGSAAPPFRGDGALHNPEDLLVAALSACHCLSYLALAAQHRLVVTAYEDLAWGKLAMHDGGLSFERVVLKPTVTVAPGSDVTRAARLHEQAHRTCFIARSVAFEVTVEPTVVIGDERPVDGRQS